MRSCLIIITILLSFSASARATEFTVNQWTLLTGIISNSSGDVESAGDGTTQIQNPLVDYFAASLGQSATTMNVNMSWSDALALGRFLIQSTQIADCNVFGETRSISSSRINITPLTPITVQVHGEFEFSCPADFIAATFFFTAYGLSSSTTLFTELHSFTTSMGTGDGQFIIDTEFVLPVTEPWQLWSSMQFETGTGSFGHLATDQISSTSKLCRSPPRSRSSSQCYF